MKTAVLKYVCILAILFVSASNVWGFADEGADGAGNCGKLKPEVLGGKLAPCAEAAKDKDVKVSHKYCDVVKKVHTSCLCALLLSKESKSLGIKPEVAVTIPKRCKIKAKHSKDYKCGGHSVPAWEEH
ncbi:uncharacterized protein Pyn_24059 [Prunus yedoensis var. nudiflora]|uniref:Bifunctional inhibitor/plant lipid transfer protein/seed storage helical domain-containing protein n=1 Tax=Prunus yedoensis var. nudiflora TaxID=2094558 RepID=A0A314XLJ3_PRUYE|nr:uncharacterized protein Pyn_24059 [Prunus yedoensis var. nudiflora]